MSIVERILGIFLSYAELAQGWNPQEEDDYQDFVNAVDNALAPAEQAKRLECRFGEGGIGIVPGDVAGRPAVFLTEVAAPGEVGKPIPKGECGETRVVLTFPTKEQASRVAAALAQNAQGDPVLEIGECAEVIWHQGGPCQLPPGAKLYLHAERARVPTDAMLAAFVHTWNGGSEWLPSPMNLTKRQLARARKAYDAFLAADPPQPEDADHGV